MSEASKIISFAHVRSGQISVRDTILFDQPDLEGLQFLKAAYRNLEIDYPKFHRMDGLSMLAFLAAEVLLSEARPNDLETTALILANNSSSLATDRSHQALIQDSEARYPSPKVFVYTLPNICMGELSIRHGMHSENAFLVAHSFNPEVQVVYGQELMQTGSTTNLLGGWVEFDGNNYDAFLYLTAANGTEEFSSQRLHDLYQKK